MNLSVPRGWAKVLSEAFVWAKQLWCTREMTSRQLQQNSPGVGEPSSLHLNSECYKLETCRYHHEKNKIRERFIVESMACAWGW